MLRERMLMFRIVAVDLLHSRRAKMNAIYDVLDENLKQGGPFVVAAPEHAKELVAQWTANTGCNAVMEVSSLL